MNKKTDHLFDQAHGGGVDQAAVVGDDGDKHKRHLDAAVLHSHGHADFKKCCRRTSGWGRRSLRLTWMFVRRLLSHTSARATLAVCAVTVPSAAPTGPSPHVADKQKIERDVDDACHANYVHGRARIA